MRIQRQCEAFAYRIATFPLDYSTDELPVAGPRKYTDEDWQKHAADVEQKLNQRILHHSKGGGVPDGQPVQDSYWQYSTQDPITGTRKISAMRQAVHDQILQELVDRMKEYPREHRAIMLGGLGGSGKGGILKDSRTGIRMKDDPYHPGEQIPADYFVINPDEIKEIMAEKGYIPHVDGLTPMEASPLVHEEASDLAKDLAKMAYEQGTNVVWDYTMGSKGSALSRLNEMKAKGYNDIGGVFVDVDPDTAWNRSQHRWRGGQQAAPTGKPYVGGRPLLKWAYNDWTPQIDGSGKYSRNAENFDALASAGAFPGGYISYDNTDSPDPAHHIPGGRPGQSVPRVQKAAGKWANVPIDAAPQTQVVASYRLARRIMAELNEDVDPASVRGLLRSYRHQQIGFPDLVDALVNRYMEIGPQSRQRTGEYYNDAEEIPDDDSGWNLESAVRRGFLTPKELDFILAEVGRAFAQSI